MTGPYSIGQAWNEIRSRKEIYFGIPDIQLKKEDAYSQNYFHKHVTIATPGQSFPKSKSEETKSFFFKKRKLYVNYCN